MVEGVKCEAHPPSPFPSPPAGERKLRKPVAGQHLREDFQLDGLSEPYWG